MINTKVERSEIRLYDAAMQTQGLDICDDTFDWGTFFCCEENWEQCKDYYDKFMLLLALNIKCVTIRNDWYSPCLVKEFIMENISVFKKFFNENNREGYRPQDYENADDGDADEGFFEAYMEPMESLLVGNYSEDDYKELYEQLTKEVK